MLAAIVKLAHKGQTMDDNELREHYDVVFGMYVQQQFNHTAELIIGKSFDKLTTRHSRQRARKLLGAHGFKLRLTIYGWGAAK